MVGKKKRNGRKGPKRKKKAGAAPAKQSYIETQGKKLTYRVKRRGNKF